MEAIFQVVIERENEGFVTYVPALDFASTHGATREEALERTRELILGYIDAAKKVGASLPLAANSRDAEIVELAISA